jgi:hypothetical protein
LLAYIDIFKRKDNKIEEIEDYIDTMMKFLNIRNWPRTFDSWIQNRKRQLNE